MSYLVSDSGLINSVGILSHGVGFKSNQEILDYPLTVLPVVDKSSCLAGKSLLQLMG